MSAADVILDVSKLGVSFGGIKALQAVDFQVKRGSITAIIGPNGAGKTTVFNCVTGFYRANQGRIRYLTDHGEAHDVHKLLGEHLQPSDFFKPGELLGKMHYKLFGGSHQLAALGIARTFQNIRLFRELTAIENLLVAQHRRVNRNIIAGLLQTGSFRASEQQAVDHAKNWLDIVGLSEFANRLAGELPYGHQRRLEIARAMCSDAKLICLDEPAAGLNQRETSELAKLIRRLRDDFSTTVLVIEHDMSLVMDISEHIVVLDHGIVIAAGTPKEIRNNQKVLEAYLGQDD